MKRLTPDQRRMVEENAGIARIAAYRMVNSGFVPRAMTEDAVQEAMIGLMQAAQAYDPQRGIRFSTMAMCCCTNRIRNTVSRDAKRRSLNERSLDETFGEDDAELPNLFAAEDNTEEQAVAWIKDAVYQILEEADKPHYAVMLTDYASGTRMADIAKERGVSRQRVCKQIGRARQIVQEAMAHADW